MLLKAESLALRYPNGALGIEDVSLAVDEGQIVALIGANGAGKTTTCRALSGKPPYASTGRSFSFGTEVSRMSSDRSCPSRFCSTTKQKSCSAKKASTVASNGKPRMRMKSAMILCDARISSASRTAGSHPPSVMTPKPAPGRLMISGAGTNLAEALCLRASRSITS